METLVATAYMSNMQTELPERYVMMMISGRIADTNIYHVYLRGRHVRARHLAMRCPHVYICCAH